MDELAGKPSGFTVRSLWRSMSALRPVAEAEVTRLLVGFQLAGSAAFRDGRWFRVGALSGPPAGGGTEPEGERLKATPCRVAPGAAYVPPPEPLGDGDLTPSLALLRRLIPHYRTCLRNSGKAGAITTPERFKQQFLLLRPDRRWRPGAGMPTRLDIARDELPAKFLEGLHKRRNQTLSLGYPLSMWTARDGESFICPAGALECSWRLSESNDLILDPVSASPKLNPAWLSRLRGSRNAARAMEWFGARAEGDDGYSGAIDGEWADFGELARSVGLFAAADCRQRLDPDRVADWLSVGAQNGIYNVLGLFLPVSNKYTAGSVRDLDALEKWTDQQFVGTALGTLFGLEPPEQPKGKTPLAPLRLGEDQMMAAREALTAPLTSITGPPGTGKTQVVCAALVSAAANGGSALFASRTHQALDNVEDRLADLLPGRLLTARAKAQEPEREFDFARALDALLAQATEPSARKRLDNAMGAARHAESRLRELSDAARAATEQSDELGRLNAEIQTAETDPPPPTDEAPQPFLWRLLLALLLFQRKRPAKPEDLIARLRAELDEAEDRHRLLASNLENLISSLPLATADANFRAASVRLLPLLADALLSVGPDERERLTALRGDLGLNASSVDSRPAINRQIWENNGDIVLSHFPLWTVTTLSAATRIPLVPGLFDTLLIDEATTCDIASALPLLARAKRAVVVGDKAQTAMIADIDPAREREMLAEAGLNVRGIGRYAFSQTTLFDFVSSDRRANLHLLRGHFRCHPDMAEYVSETFYGGRLFVLTAQQGLRTPTGDKPGLHWTEIEGPLERAGTGCVSDSEARAVADALHELLEVRGYDGTVGVVTPFIKQAEAILRLCDDRITPERRLAADLRVATSHAFQGDARDVIILSLCYGPNMPAGASWFMGQSRELINVAVSRAKAVCRIFGNRQAALSSNIPHLAALARRTLPREPGFVPEQPFESPWEKRLHDALAARGFNPVPQYPLAGKRLDLALVSDKIKIDIEVDGEAFHRDPDGFRKVSDLARDELVCGLGWKVMRFWVYQLRDDMGGCVDRIVAEL